MITAPVSRLSGELDHNYEDGDGDHNNIDGDVGDGHDNGDDGEIGDGCDLTLVMVIGEVGERKLVMNLFFQVPPWPEC